MLIINFEGREVKGLSKGRYDETFDGEDDMIHDMRFPKMWYVGPAKPQISLRLRAV